MTDVQMSKQLSIQEQAKLLSEENARLASENQKLDKEKELLGRRLQNLEDAFEKLGHLSGFAESASEIAHEINNPINFISGSLNIIKRGVKDLIELMEMYRGLSGIKEHPDYKKLKDLEDDIDVALTQKELTDAAGIIEKGMERIHEIAYNLSLLGKKEAPTPIKLNVNQSIKDTLLMIQEIVSGQMEIRTELGNIPEIMSYRGKLNQVFTNIIKNSMEAVMAKTNLDGDYLLVRTEAKGDHISILIKDTGVGMSAETRDHLFEKFYTTKTSGKSKGLGMGVCKDIIEKHKGSISVESEPGKGTEVLITLPLMH